VRCGTRYSAETGRERPLLSCLRCELPYLGDRVKEGICADCAAGSVPDDLPHASLAAATEQEILSALESRQHFLTSEASSAYLDSLLRRVAQHFEDSPAACRVVLLDDPSLKTLALPSGTILLSQETLADVEDEAQLVFLLAHELAHAVCDATRHLIRIGLRQAAQTEPAQDDDAWLGIAEDMMRLGYGKRREREADARALRAVLELGYDTSAVVRYLRHVEMLEARADDRVRELALAHPPASDRIRRAEEILAGHVDTGEERLLNREVFRRAAQRHVSGVSRAALSEIAAAEEQGPASTRVAPWVPWVGVLGMLVVTLLALFLWVL
jgi:predicted Zn-dependent protease